MAADAEEVQELGRRGVATLKRWLEATTYIELPFDVYNNTPDCTVKHKRGMKKFDLSGYYLTGRKRPIYVESKRYSSDGRQYDEFKEFLRIAYSSAMTDIEEYGRDRERHFYWITYHPFRLGKWKYLEKATHLIEALNEDPEHLGGNPVDQDLVRDVAKRVTVLVFNKKQKRLSLTKKELIKVRRVINRKAKEL